jgi:hypothetical protein
VNTTLKDLDLCSNSIGDVAAKNFGKAIAWNSSLESLGLAVNGIGDVGAKYLGEAIAQNSSLKFLSLIGNEIGDTFLVSGILPYHLVSAKHYGRILVGVDRFE